MTKKFTFEKHLTIKLKATGTGSRALHFRFKFNSIILAIRTIQSVNFGVILTVFLF